jgi:predicted NBD/HSP70 family sugar kinase
MTSAVVAIPGPLSYQEGPFILPNLPGWAPHISKALLTEALEFTTVIVHDTDLGVLGEHAFGAGRGVDDLVCITISTGVGAGVVLGGRSAPRAARARHGRDHLIVLKRTSSSRARCPQTKPRLHARRHSTASTADALAHLF